MLKILVLGSGDLARGVVDGLLDSPHQLVGVYPWEFCYPLSFTQRVKRSLVGDHISYYAAKGLSLLRFPSANSQAFRDNLKDLQPDVVLVSAWGEILKADTIALPKVACVNTHPSLLPAHRGGNPIASVLREGESQTGLSFHYLNEKIDAGDLLLQSAIDIDDSDDYVSLGRKLAFRARETVVDAMANLLDADFHAQPQNAAEASYYKGLQASDLILDWHLTARQLCNRIRATNARQVYWTQHQGQRLNVFSAQTVKLYRPCSQPGRVLGKSGSHILVATGDPQTGLFLGCLCAPGKLGAIRGKWYALKRIQVGDRLG